MSVGRLTSCIHYFPNDALNTKDAYSEDFRQELLEVPVDSVLYIAYTAADEEGNPSMCTYHKATEGGVPCYLWDSMNAKCNIVELGSLVSRSKLYIPTTYIDNGILFKHGRCRFIANNYLSLKQQLANYLSIHSMSGEEAVLRL